MDSDYCEGTDYEYSSRRGEEEEEEDACAAAAGGEGREKEKILNMEILPLSSCGLGTSEHPPGSFRLRVTYLFFRIKRVSNDSTTISHALSQALGSPGEISAAICRLLRWVEKSRVVTIPRAIYMHGGICGWPVSSWRSIKQ